LLKLSNSAPAKRNTEENCAAKRMHRTTAKKFQQPVNAAINFVARAKQENLHLGKTIFLKIIAVIVFTQLTTHETQARESGSTATCKLLFEDDFT
jgi:hypothetical protein